MLDFAERFYVLWIIKFFMFNWQIRQFLKRLSAIASGVRFINMSLGRLLHHKLRPIPWWQTLTSLLYQQSKVVSSFCCPMNHQNTSRKLPVGNICHYWLCFNIYNLYVTQCGHPPLFRDLFWRKYFNVTCSCNNESTIYFLYSAYSGEREK